MKQLVLSTIALWNYSIIQGFQIISNPPRRHQRSIILLIQAPPSRERVVLHDNEFLDVEFERNVPEESKTKKKKKKKSNTPKQSISQEPLDDDDDDDEDTGKSLFDLSLESGDLDWKRARIPFVDVRQETVIDGTLAFCVDLDGVTYGIATPCDHAAAITVEDVDGSVVNVSPDVMEDEKEELLHIMATQLVEHVGSDLALKKTPRVLTITGDLDQYTKDWKSKLLPNTVPVQELLKDDDEDLNFFHDFMRRELGQEEYDKTMAEPTTAEDIGDDILELFDIPGWGERQDDVEGVNAMLQSLLDEEDPRDTLGELGGEHLLDHPGAALKLVSYVFKNGKSYSLVKLFKPYTLVGRLNTDIKEGLQFELMTPEEEKLVIPKLEKICQEELKQAGLDLAP